MICVLLAIGCYFITSVTLKVGVQRDLDPTCVNLMVRTSGVTLTAVLLGLAGTAAWQQPHLGIAGAVGLAAGICTFLSGYSSLLALEVGSMNATWALMRSATVMPVLASIVLWGELRGVTDWQAMVPKIAGILCLLAALVLLGRGARA